MHRTLAFAAATLAVGVLAPRGSLPHWVVHEAAAAGTRPDVARAYDDACGPGLFADGRACVHLTPLAPASPMERNAHHNRSGTWVVYDEIPRRPDRPADYDDYVYPVPPGLPGGHSVISGFDLDRPDLAQRRGPTLHAVGHGGVDLPQAKGTPIHMVPLEDQQGDADVVYVGTLFGNTVVTRHTLREGGGLRDYILLFGHLDAPASGLARGSRLRAGDVVGTVGDTGSPELVHLHLEARRVREGVDIMSIASPARLLAPEISVVCDPRNVLPLRQDRRR